MALELDINHIELIPIRNKKLHIEEMPQLMTNKKYLVVDEIYDTGEHFLKSNVQCKILIVIMRFL